MSKDRSYNHIYGIVQADCTEDTHMRNACEELERRANAVRLKKMKKRLLRQYRRVAFTDHTCWRCRFLIDPGDEYQAEVWVYKNPIGVPSKKSLLAVVKWHVRCPDDPYEDEILRELEAERFGEQKRAAQAA